MKSRNIGHNQHNNQAHLMRFEERNQLADHALRGLEVELLACTHFVIEYMISPPSGRPPLVSSELEQLTSEQFAKLYHGISWSLVALFCSRHKGFTDELYVLHSAVIAPFEQSSSSELVEAIESVFRTGAFDFMALKLFERMKEILELPDESPAGAFVLIPILTACVQKLEY